jgi:hypothetical protein
MTRVCVRFLRKVVLSAQGVKMKACGRNREIGSWGWKGCGTKSWSAVCKSCLGK